MPESPDAKARTRALRILARREKSRAGLRRILRRAGFGPETVEPVLQQLVREGFLDDLRFCRLYLGEQARARPRSVRLLRRDLRAEGIEGEVIEQALLESGEDLREPALAEAAARKKLRAAASDPAVLRRLLAARGFAPSTVREALRAVLPPGTEADEADEAGSGYEGTAPDDEP